MEKQIGNFLVVEDNESGMLSVRAVCGFWEISFRSDHIMYGTLKHLCADDRCADGLGDVISAWFTVTSTVLDHAGCLSAYELAVKQAERWADGSSVNAGADGEADDERILDEELRSEELRSEFSQHEEGVM